VSMLESALAFQPLAIAAISTTARRPTHGPGRTTRSPWFVTKDGQNRGHPHVVPAKVLAGDDLGTGREDLAIRSRFSTADRRIENYDLVRKTLRRGVGRWSRAAVLERLYSTSSV